MTGNGDNALHEQLEYAFYSYLKPPLLLVSMFRQAVAVIGRAEDEGSTVADSEISVASLQRRRLQRKLQNLQEKKQQMDELLEKLQNLKADQELLDGIA